MKRIFISQPFGDRSNKEILIERDRIKNKLKRLLNCNIQIIDSLFYEKYENPLWCLGKSIELMADADIIFFAKGWEKARGCRIEYLCAKEYGYEIMEEIL